MSKEISSNTEKVVRGMSSQTLVTIVLGVVEIVSFSIMSRLLTQEDFGYYAAITAITTVFASFSETGIGAALIQRKEINQRFINNAFTISLIFGLFISLLLFCSSGIISRMVLDSSMILPLRLMSITLLCNCLVSVNLSLMQRELKFFRVGLIHLISLIVTTVVAIVLALNGFGYYAILTKAILTSLLTLVLSYVSLKVRFALALDSQTFKSIFGFSGWLMASVFFRNFAQQADRLLMGRLLSVNSLGAYNRPKEFINQITNKAGGVFDTALFPVLSSIQDQKDSIVNAYKKSLYCLCLFGSFLSVLLFFNSNLIIRIFLGTDWLSVLTTFKILSLIVLALFLSRLADCYLRSLALTKQQFCFRIGETIINMIAVVIGSRFGINGVAIAVLIISYVISIIKIYFISFKVKVPIRITIRIALSSCRYCLVFIPALLLFYLFLPNTAFGSIIIAFVFLGMSIILFMGFPDFIGNIYKLEIYTKIMAFINKKRKNNVED